MSDKYNGWTNYETWRINLEMIDGMTAADFGVIERDPNYRDCAVEDLAERLESYVAEVVEADAKGFALDLATSFLARVDWEEIAEHMIDDYQAERV